MHPKISHSIHKKDLLLKYQEQQTHTAQLQEQALQEATRLARILVDQFGVDTVYLFGPLAYYQFQEGMHLELALQGIPEGAYATMLAHVRESSGFGVELIDFAETDGWTRRSILEKGKILAKKNN